MSAAEAVSLRSSVYITLGGLVSSGAEGNTPYSDRPDSVLSAQGSVSRTIGTYEDDEQTVSPDTVQSVCELLVQLGAHGVRAIFKWRRLVRDE
ncbi:hypothetical protein BC834DRAFT_969682 [Gloeopeniophorella convolvens]|nr:hypothetical protein BC834DRAFT_969682 [Gloeopeniophorella convolvens]